MGRSSRAQPVSSPAFFYPAIGLARPGRARVAYKPLLNHWPSTMEDTTINTQTIGETAGAIWQYLKDHGKTTLKALEKVVDAPVKEVSMAAGWLAREGKVEVAQKSVPSTSGWSKADPLLLN